MILCVTGPMAAGKNAAADILEQKGFACVDADIVAHKAIENSKQKILEEFGPLAAQKNITLLNPDGTINRRNLGAILFTDKTLIEKQESIVYPEVNALLEQFIEQNKGRNIVINATLLYKVPLIKKMDFVLFIDAPRFLRLKRALKRDKLSVKQILQRFSAQNNLFAKYIISNADIRRVWNTGSRKSLEKKIEKFLT